MRSARSWMSVSTGPGSSDVRVTSVSSTLLQRFGERLLERVRGVVDRLGRARLGGGDRRGDEHPSGAAHVEVEDAEHVVEVLVDDRLPEPDADVRRGGVDAPAERRDRAAQLCTPSQVPRSAARPAPPTRPCAAAPRPPWWVVLGGDDEVVAVPGARAGELGADPARGTRHEGRGSLVADGAGTTRPSPGITFPATCEACATQRCQGRRSGRTPPVAGARR